MSFVVICELSGAVLYNTVLYCIITLTHADNAVLSNHVNIKR